MKKQQLNEIKKMDIKTVTEEARKIKKELANLQIEKNIAKLTNLKAFMLKRKDLAQILTVLKQKQLLKELEEGGKQ